MWPKTLHSVRGNASVRVWNQSQAAALGPGWISHEEPIPEPVQVAEVECKPLPIIRRKRGRPKITR